jgi:RluA family pseudouridine synthase
MAKPNSIELPDGSRIPILYEDRSVLAVDKPRGWMLVPFSWQNTNRNLQAAITSSIAAGDFWATSRNLKYLRNIHRLDADTSGILLFAKSVGGLDTYSDMFESRKMEKAYLVVVHGTPKKSEWSCNQMIGPDPDQIGKMKVDPREGKDAETHFRVLQSQGNISLLEARPITGRTHQIRLHLLASGHPVVGDNMYGPKPTPGMPVALGLRSVYLGYPDPFLKRQIHIQAPLAEFMNEYRFKGAEQMGAGYFSKTPKKTPVPTAKPPTPPAKAPVAPVKAPVAKASAKKGP